MPNDWGFGEDESARPIRGQGDNDHNQRLHQEKLERQARERELRSRKPISKFNGRTSLVWGGRRIHRKIQPINWGRLLDDD